LRFVAVAPVTAEKPIPRRPPTTEWSVLRIAHCRRNQGHPGAWRASFHQRELHRTL